MSVRVDTAGAEFFPARAEIIVPAGVVGPEPSPVNVHAFVIRSGGEVALVDTLLLPDHAEVIGDAMVTAGAGFADIKYVVLTHHHVDHCGGLAEIAQRAPQALILCGAGDIEAIRGSTGISADAVGSGETVLGLEVMASPGHTPGHLCLFDPGSSTMLLGDMVGNMGTLTRPPASLIEDADMAETSLQAVAERDFENALPSHGNPLIGGASRALRRLVAERG